MNTLIIISRVGGPVGFTAVDCIDAIAIEAEEASRRVLV